MAFTRPTLTQIIERVESDFKTGFGLTTILRRSFEKVHARVIAGVSHTLHGAIDYAINKRFFPGNGVLETNERWGTLYNLPRLEAEFAEIEMDVVGTTGGSVVAGSTVYQRSDGALYTVKDSVAIGAGDTETVTVTSNTAGEDFNLNNGDTLELQSAIAGIESTGTVTNTTVAGTDDEDEDLYEERVLQRLQDPPAGGTVTDYIAFARTISGVTRVWVLPNFLGQNTVGLTFVRDDDDPIIPDTAEVEEVQNAVLQLHPIPADLTTFAPTEFEMNPQIQLSPNTTEVQNAVIAELNDMLTREAQVRDAVDPDQVGNGVQFDGKISLSLINEAISIASGEEDHVTLSPSADVQPPSGGIVTLGTPVFSDL